ncbi:SARP family transcriptional regulator [Longispora fulva]|uniref:DNA-binding SARP family transcriptional activator/Tfp pilus assembly protein PilF n=1 Tax=Longispora fulva TaxID=619741 RepID=A0A8J7KPA7_9ACTN|nr:BTAD domain-containing putative transcriptional regulator [Longispora fulva]MBG6136092.1 DNA-binding SARP family transcriptional activator/Tfp pilus assembly protein PilF [Longispora fulva]GIG55663.1 SARP family transcriptional regulator [Longispora fulva]
MGVRFTVLGPVRLSAADRPSPALAPRHRAVLAYLLLHAGTGVRADRLVDAVWGAAPPDTARAQIQTAVSAIRRALRAIGAPAILTTGPAGYAILPEPGQLDLELFTGGVAAAAALAATGEREKAARELRTALSLWRGEAFADLTAHFVTDARALLADRRLTAVERLAELDLTLGRPDDLIDELTELCARHPLRERPLELLMTALYRTGRHAEALTRYDAARRRFADELGLDLTPELTELHARILRHDVEPAPATRLHLPRSLPYAVGDFTGRRAETQRVLDLAADRAGTVVISAIDGMPGVGKTALAVHVAHTLAGQYPDGQLFCDLHGFTPGRAPLGSNEALHRLLRALGVHEETIPAEQEERSALWRSSVAGRRLLILLDNAADAAQVRPLIPGVPGSLVLITSRRRLTTLDGATSLALDVLMPAAARTLFTAAAGPAARAEPEAVEEVLRLCGYLPLAVRIAAGRVGHGARPVARLATALAAEHDRLAELAVDDRDVAAAFALSHDALRPAERRLFSLLGLLPGTDVDPHAAAALIGLTPEATERLLRGLRDAHLLTAGPGDRYGFHDLLRLYAADRAAALPEPDRRAALDRLTDHCLQVTVAAVAAAGLDTPASRHPVPGAARPGTLTFAGPAEALAWLDAERANLITLAGRAGPEFGYLLATALSGYLDVRAHHRESLVLYDQVRRIVADPVRRADLLRFQASAHNRLAEYDQALDLAHRALEAHRDAGDAAGQAGALNQIGMIHTQRGELRQAVDSLRAAMELDAGGPTLINLAIGYARLGDYEAAARHYTAARAAGRQVCDRYVESRALVNLGTIHQHQARPAEATLAFRQAIDLERSGANRQPDGNTLANLGEAYRRTAEYDLAAETFHRAIDLHRDSGNRVAEGFALKCLGQVYHHVGREQCAIDHQQRALAIAREAGARILEGAALTSLGEATLALGRPASAVGHYEAALRIANDSGDLYTQGRSHEGLGLARRALGERDAAAAHLGAALRLYTRLGQPLADALRARLDALAAH